ncbi:MAG: hypothetical protein HKL85_06340 [Acidimicrobiaceae bacterium]|nr:hypothetical protein [Acidimicrobiaceae bacterium]
MTSLHASRNRMWLQPHGARFITSLVAVASLVLSLGPVSRASAATPTAFASESGHQIMSTALSDALTKSSCTSSTATKISGQSYSSTTNSAMTTGQQTLVIGNAWTIVRVFNGVVYIKENVTAMQEQFGVSDPKAVNRWIAIPRIDSNFARFNTYILLPSMLSEVTPSGTLKTTSTTTLNHEKVVGVTGKPNIHLGLASGTETVYVTTAAPHVLVEMVASDIVQGQRETFVITYSNWGMNFHIVKPSPVVDISTTKLPK